MKNSNFKITYHQEGDYLIPDLVIKKETNNYQIGKYGYLRLNFLKNHKRGLYCELCLKNELNKHSKFYAMGLNPKPFFKKYNLRRF